MSNTKYFSDINGKTFELTFIRSIPTEEFRRIFPSIHGIKADGYSMLVGSEEFRGLEMPITRQINYKKNPSKHECNARCLNGKCGGTCECQCGGRNHGKGNCN